VAKSEGYWIAEAMEDFEDSVNGQKTFVKAGEQRILPPKLVSKRKVLHPPIREHAYELQMEKKVKRLIEKEEQQSKT
jgi:hypothetical protein